MARFTRASGVLLHPTALSGPYGIGTLGVQALAFLDWLQDAGQSYWQICPLVPTGYGDSPYQGFSAFAGNPNLIDLADLLNSDLLIEADLKPLRNLPEDYVDFGRLIPAKAEVLQKAWKRYNTRPKPPELEADLEIFKTRSSTWLDDYCLFMVLKAQHDGRPWDEWDAPLRFRDPGVLVKAKIEFINEIGYHTFVQFLFHRQWTALKNEAKQRGISIIGDLPIFIAYDSSDCWANPDLFQLSEERRPTCVAGVPPDYFSSTGQLWGNPLYNWKKMERNGFLWWISVLKDKLEHYDVLRIDHFRGFSAYWSVPFGESTAINGEWIPAPGRKLFSRIREVLGELPIIAEDLGVITDDVTDLIKEFGFPGMKVLQFAFDSSEENDYLPHNYENHCLVYTGTHDNDTAAGWYDSAPDPDRETARKYLGLSRNAGGAEAASAMLRAAMASVSDIAVTPLQDILGLGSEARFNTPGTLGGNWIWRSSNDSIGRDSSEYLRELTKTYGRLPR